MSDLLSVFVTIGVIVVFYVGWYELDMFIRRIKEKRNERR